MKRYKRLYVVLAVLLAACIATFALSRYKCCFANKLRKIFIQSAKKKRRLKGF